MKNKEISPNVPNLRFPEFDGEWEGIANDILLKQVSEKNKKLEYTNILSASQTDGMVLRSSLGIDMKFDANAINGYKIVRKGDYVIHLRSFQGGFAFSDVTGICSPAYIILRPSEKLQYGFLKKYFMSEKFINSLRLVTYGIRDGKSISTEEWLKLSSSIPQTEEQKKISSFLSLIDDRISTQMKIIERLESLIKGLSGKLFSIDTTDYDRLDCMYIKGKAGGTPITTNNLYYNGNIPFLSISDISEQGKYIYETSKCISDLGLNNSAAWIVPKNSLILSMYASVGLPTINKIDIATSQAMFSMIINNYSIVEYLYYFLLHFKETQLHKYLETGTQSNINADMVRSILIPNYGIDNNVAITKILRAVDEKICDEKSILSTYQKQKKYLLQEMFI